MSPVDQVRSDAKSEFIISIATALVSCGSTGAGGSDTQGGNDARLLGSGVKQTPPGYAATLLESQILIKNFIGEGNEIQLHCTEDLRALIKHLFKDEELSKIGFASPKVMLKHAYRNPRSDTVAPSRRVEMYLLRPTLSDASLLKANLQFNPRNYYPVICFPDVSDMFPEILQSTLGERFTVGDVTGGNKQVRLFPCNVHMAPIEDYALSMFLSDCLHEFYKEGDPMLSWFFAKAIEYMECRIIGGTIPTITSVGHLSKFVSETLVRARRDYAADMVMSASDKGNTLSDLSVMSERLRTSQESMRGAAATGAESDSNTEPETEKERRRRLLGISPVIDEAVFMDRMVDMVTPMCLNFTYEGMLDDVFGIEEQQVCLPPGVMDKHSSAAPGVYDQYSSNFGSDGNVTVSQKGSRLHLCSTLYKEIRWLNYGDAGRYLHQKALQANKGYDSGELTNIGAMGDFVKKFKTLQKEHSELSTHVNIMSWISSLLNGDVMQTLRQLEDYILQPSPDVNPEDSKLASITAKLFRRPTDPCVTMLLDLIYSNVEVRQVYRLLILLTQTRGGIKGDRLHSMKSAIVNQYGLDQMATLNQLEVMGLIKVKDSPDCIRWIRLCKKLNLLVDRETSVSDYSAVFGGYAPISLRLLQLILVSQGVSALQSELELLNSPVGVLKRKSLIQFDHKETCPYKLFGLLGGVTLGELASLALINQKKSRKIVLLATNVTNVGNIVHINV